MADNILNAENFEIVVILGNLDIDENIVIQNELFQNDTDASKITGLDEDVWENIDEEDVLAELSTTPEILFIDENDISKVHIDKKNQTGMNLKKLHDQGAFLFEKQHSRQKPYQMHVSVCCKERKVQFKEGRSVYCLFAIVVHTYGYKLG